MDTIREHNRMLFRAVLILIGLVAVGVLSVCVVLGVLGSGVLMRLIS